MRRHKEERLGEVEVEREREREGDVSRCSSDKPLDCDSSTIILTPQVKVEAFSSRNQFDRASQLRRSKKKRRKSEAGSSVLSPGRERDDSLLSNSRAEYSSNYGNLI